MASRNENHGLSSCTGSSYCIDCGGVCSQDLLGDAGPYKPMAHVFPQLPVEIPGPDYLDRFRNYRRGGL